MKITINKEEYQKVVLSNFEIELPEETIYLFLTGIRQAYMITPVWTSWNQEHYQKPEELYQFNILVVDPTDRVVTTHTLNVSSIADLLNNNKGNSPLYTLAQALWINPHNSDKRTREQFMEDYKQVLEHFRLRVEEVVSKQVSTQTR